MYNLLQVHAILCLLFLQSLKFSEEIWFMVEPANESYVVNNLLSFFMHNMTELPPKWYIFK